MGLCQSQASVGMKLEMVDSRTQKIDTELMEAHLTDKKVLKILLLGTSECGKSTIVKQMRILHDQGFTSQERIQHRSAVYQNLISGMATLLDGMDQLALHFSIQHLKAESDLVQKAANPETVSEVSGNDVARAIKALWADKNVKDAALQSGDRFQLPESAVYFFENLDRISEQFYCPSDDDLIMTRIKSTGIVEVHLKIRSKMFHIYDVGGHRSERKKWIHCFEGIHAVIFITAINEFDQVLAEDDSTNRIVESVKLFESICNSRWFVRTSMILFLNKIDLFAEKIKRKSIKATFQDYMGDENSFGQQVDFLRTKFKALNKNPEKQVYTHQTCAINTEQFKLVSENVVEYVVQNNLGNYGLV